MGIQKSTGTTNGSGYVDPTVGEALRNIDEQRYIEHIVRTQRRHSGILRADDTPAKSFGRYIAQEMRRNDQPKPDAQAIKQARQAYNLCAQTMALLGIKIEDCTLRLKGGYIMTRDEIIPKEDK